MTLVALIRKLFDCDLNELKDLCAAVGECSLWLADSVSSAGRSQGLAHDLC